MEAKLLFFTRSENGRWSLTAQSISTIQLDTTPSIPSLEETDYPSPLSELINLISKKCANNGIMDGWKLHQIDEPLPMEYGNGYHTKAIFTRTLPSPDPPCPSRTDSNSKVTRKESQ